MVVKCIKMAECGRTWLDSEIALLIEVWSDGSIFTAPRHSLQ